MKTIESAGHIIDLSTRSTLIILSVFLLGLFLHCERFEPEAVLKVSTGGFQNLTGNSVTVEGSIIYLGNTDIIQHGFCYGLNASPTVEVGEKIELGSRASRGDFTGNLSGLTPNTRYYVKAFATDKNETVYGSALSFDTESDNTVTDIDGNVYQTVQIGSQVWMAENLNVTRFADGSSILLVSDVAGWQTVGINDKAYSYYNNSTTLGETYGALYTWGAAMNGGTSSDGNPSSIQGVCPDNWHLPSDAEWKELEMYLGMTQAQADGESYRGTNEGGKLKETGFSHWLSPNTDATNESGFTALPGGSRSSDGMEDFLGEFARFWTATEYNSTRGWFRTLYYNTGQIFRDHIDKNYSRSVRCVKD